MRAPKLIMPGARLAPKLKNLIFTPVYTITQLHRQKLPMALSLTLTQIKFLIRKVWGSSNLSGRDGELRLPRDQKVRYNLQGYMGQDGDYQCN